MAKFMPTQPLPAFDAAAISRKGPIAADHPMSRNHDVDRIGTIGTAARPARVWMADYLCELSVRRCGACRNTTKFGPQFALKSCSPIATGMLSIAVSSPAKKSEIAFVMHNGTWPGVNSEATLPY